ncbi:hypothetical protein LXL04_026557 [Taraxacum kok-saghyz]
MNLGTRLPTQDGRCSGMLRDGPRTQVAVQGKSPKSAPARSRTPDLRPREDYNPIKQLTMSEPHFSSRFLLYHKEKGTSLRATTKEEMDLLSSVSVSLKVTKPHQYHRFGNQGMSYLNFSRLQVKIGGNETVKTCPAAMGFAFVTGSTDEPGVLTLRKGQHLK